MLWLPDRVQKDLEKKPCQRQLEYLDGTSDIDLEEGMLNFYPKRIDWNSTKDITPAHHYIIGSSMVRHMHYVYDTQTISIPGGSITDSRKAYDKILLPIIEKIDSVTLVTGGNSITETKSKLEATQMGKNIAEELLCLANHIHLSSGMRCKIQIVGILPRPQWGKGLANEARREANAVLKRKSRYRPVFFHGLNKNFQNNGVADNRWYGRDNIHLNQMGQRKLRANLDQIIKQKKSRIGRRAIVLDRREDL
jgi:lysophospholipase L1-like esterase